MITAISSISYRMETFPMLNFNRFDIMDLLMRYKCFKWLKQSFSYHAMRWVHASKICRRSVIAVMYVRQWEWERVIPLMIKNWNSKTLDERITGHLHEFSPILSIACDQYKVEYAWIWNDKIMKEVSNDHFQQIDSFFFSFSCHKYKWIWSSLNHSMFIV